MESRTPYLNPSTVFNKGLPWSLSFPAGKMGITSTPLSRFEDGKNKYVHAKHFVQCWVEGKDLYVVITL